MQACFSEPGSDPLIEEMVEIMLDASPEVLITQKAESDWARVPALLPLLTCPTLFIHGDADAMLSLAEVEAVANTVPKAQLQIIPGGGHRPNIRSPSASTRCLADFLLT